MADDAAKKDPTAGRAWYSLLAIDPDGDTKNIQCDANGNLIIGGLDLSGVSIDAVGIKDATSSSTKVAVLTTDPANNTAGMAVREVTQNFGLVVLASGARTTTQTQADQTNARHKGLQLIIDVTSAGTGSITPKLQGKDANGIYYDILVGSPITSDGTNVLKLYLGLVPIPNAVVSDLLPSTWRCVITADNANSMTYSVAAEILV